MHLLHDQKNVQGRWAASHPHLAFLHGSLEAQQHLTNSRTEKGAKATSGDKVTGFNVFDASSRLHPYFVASTDERLAD